MVDNTLFYKRLTEQLQLIKKSRNQVERELGYARNALHNYKIGRKPSGERLLELATYFEVDPYYLIGEKNINTEKKESTKAIFNQLNHSQKKEMLVICEEWFFNEINTL